jgi:hypothetical protein
VSFAFAYSQRRRESSTGPTKMGSLTQETMGQASQSGEPSTTVRTTMRRTRRRRRKKKRKTAGTR